MIKELAIISGKGGTGKTSLAASFAVLDGEAVIAVAKDIIEVWRKVSSLVGRS